MAYNPNNLFSKTQPMTDVGVTYDPRVVTDKSSRKAMTSAEIELYHQESIRGTGLGTMTNQALSQSQGKSDRLANLQAKLIKRKAKTVAEVTAICGVAPVTARSYLKELGYGIDRLGNIVYPDNSK